MKKNKATVQRSSAPVLLGSANMFALLDKEGCRCDASASSVLGTEQTPIVLKQSED